MKYEPIENGFSLTFKEGEDEKTLKFYRRQKMSTWQLGKVTGYLGAIFKDCSEGAQTIFSFVVTILRMEKGEGDSLQAKRIQSKLEAMILGDGVDNLAKGGGELLSYIATENLIAKLLVVLYLKEGEGRLEEDEFTKRLPLMEESDPSLLVEGLSGFFMRGTESSKNTGLPLKTSEPTKNAQVIPMSTEATV